MITIAAGVLSISAFWINRDNREFFKKHVSRPVARVVSKPFRRKKK